MGVAVIALAAGIVAESGDVLVDGMGGIDIHSSNTNSTVESNDGAVVEGRRQNSVKEELNPNMLNLLQCLDEYLEEQGGRERYWSDVFDGREEDIAEANKTYDAMIKDVPQLNRILIARKNHPTMSRDLLLEQVRFRVRWRPSSIHPDSITNSLSSGAWRVCGYSREGYIVTNYKFKYWNPDAYIENEKKTTTKSKNKTQNEQQQQQLLQDAIDEYTRYVIYMLELSIGCMEAQSSQPDKKFIIIFDLQGFAISLAFRKNVRQMISRLIYIAQAQYPERLYKCLLVNPPYGFSTAWSLVKPLLDEKTASKVHFCSNKESLKQEIDPKVLSDAYGGSHPEYPIPSQPLPEQIRICAGTSTTANTSQTSTASSYDSD